jgi:BirA family biotin operon repressor/biotin-[acetyl-CoA-carboxylase] ligase
MEEWQEQDHFKDQNITLILGKNQVTGVARGISTSGALLVDIEDEGKTVRKEFFGGEISVRGA